MPVREAPTGPEDPQPAEVECNVCGGEGSGPCDELTDEGWHFGVFQMKADGLIGWALCPDHSETHLDGYGELSRKVYAGDEETIDQLRNGTEEVDPDGS